MKTKSLKKVLNGLPVVNGVAAGFSLIDKNFRIRWVNDTQKSWFSNNGSFVGSHCYEIYEKRKHICRGCPVIKTFQTGEICEAIRTATTVNGEKRFFHVSANPIKDKNKKVVKVLELVLDINNQVKTGLIQKSRIDRLKGICGKLKQNNQKLKSDKDRLKSIGKKTKQVNQSLAKKYKTLLKKLNYTKEELRDLYLVNRSISGNGDTTKTISLITRLAKNTLHADVVTVRLVDNENRILIPKAAVGVNKDQLMDTPLKIGQSFEGVAAKAGKVILVKDMQADNRTAYPESVKQENFHTAIFVPALFNRQPLAVIGVIYRRVREVTEEELALIKAFANQVAVAIQETTYCDDVHKNYFNTLKALVLAMEARDPYTRGHSERVTKYAMDIARKLQLPENMLSIIQFAGTVHDVGKIGISDLILNKPGKLTAAERAIIELHPIKGAQMLEPLKFIRTGIPLVRHHHERYDGAGYPDRIEGEEIPLSARILACADSFDAMTSERPYRLKKMSIQEAIAELKANSGTQFDPKIVSVFITLIKKEKYF